MIFSARPEASAVHREQRFQNSWDTFGRRPFRLKAKSFFLPGRESEAVFPDGSNEFPALFRM
jgi:hypothetical protein